MKPESVSDVPGWRQGFSRVPAQEGSDVTSKGTIEITGGSQASYITGEVDSPATGSHVKFFFLRTGK